MKHDSGDKSHRQRSLALAGVALALLAWAGLIGIGCFLFGENNDLRKPLIVGGVMSAFLAVWWCSLRLRRQKLKRR